ncbi:hypothetical protein K505DRAFT_150707 [Melanomma pulvis-pyrius CBS 109.77]|uniref:Uncharacterized protein n=1 Tax=Melanomma pulvis-pyrius CBS 109.77 TaxID=1314802 RepID=A0A6A6WQN7_9PLEO|nr:hypothetical protein K505DRAFT_150707 [Melanomma pulvis-pyrius CBS 109.77]
MEATNAIWYSTQPSTWFQTPSLCAHLYARARSTAPGNPCKTKHFWHLWRLVFHPPAVSTPSRVSWPTAKAIRDWVGRRPVVVPSRPSHPSIQTLKTGNPPASQPKCFSIFEFPCFTVPPRPVRIAKRRRLGCRYSKLGPACAVNISGTPLGLDHDDENENANVVTFVALPGPSASISVPKKPRVHRYPTVSLASSTHPTQGVCAIAVESVSR